MNFSYVNYSITCVVWLLSVINNPILNLMHRNVVFFLGILHSIEICITFLFQIVSDDTLYVKWDDSHESTYDLQWLLERNFNEGQERHEYQQVKWTAKSFSTIFRSFKYEDVIKRSYHCPVIYLFKSIQYYKLWKWTLRNP